MQRFADPTSCPECRLAITPGVPSCPACGLGLRGELAQRLFVTLQSADTLLDQLRAESRHALRVPAGGLRDLGLGGTGPAGAAELDSTPAGATVAPAAGTGAYPRPHDVGNSGEAGDTPRRRGLADVSVSRLLLGLGALCVLVAAVVFLVVTWSVLGVAGRTAVLAGLTGLTALVAAWLARADLRAAAESLSLVALGLLSLDAVGAQNAGWLGDPDVGTFLVLLGALLVVVGGAASLACRRTPLGHLTTGEVAAGLGTAGLVLGLTLLPDLDLAAALVAGTILSTAVVVAARRLRLSATRMIAVVVVAASWLGLLAVGVDRGTDRLDVAALWGRLEIWPLLAAAVLAAAPAVLTHLDERLRAASGAVALLVLTGALTLPVLDEGATTGALVASGTLALVAAGTWRLPGVWRGLGLLVQLVAGLVAAALTLSLAGVALDALLASASGWSGDLTDRLRIVAGADPPSAWLLPVLTLALLGTLASVGRLSRTLAPGSTPRLPGRSTLLVTAAALLAGAGTLSVVLTGPPVWSVVACATLVAVALLAWWLRDPSLTTAAWTGVFALGATLVSTHDDLLTALSLAATFLLAGVLHVRARVPEVSGVAGAVLAATLGLSVVTWAHVAGASTSWGVLLGLAGMAAALLALIWAPGRCWAHAEPALARAGWEVGALVAVVPLGLAGVLTAPTGESASWTALYLTLLGATTTALALLRTDRYRLLPVGGLLLAAASWVRLWDVGVRAPEAYTLPTAAVLAAVAVLHLHRHPAAGTRRTLSPALGLALVPSLLWALVEEPGLRALLLGLACLSLVVAGLVTRLSAPMAWGGAVGAVLVVYLAGPYVGNAVPRWVLIGAAGVTLIVLGVTWERRVQQARKVLGLVRALR